MGLEANITGDNLDTAGNIKVALTNTPAYMGGVRISSENDAGEITGKPYLLSPKTSIDHRLSVGMDTLLFADSFNATAQNTNNWNYNFGTLTASQPGAGTVNFGTIQGINSPNGAYMRTYQYFPLIGTAPLVANFTLGQFTSALAANEVFTFGFGSPPAGAVPPSDGCFVQITSAGIIGIISYAGTQTPTGVLAELTALEIGTLYKITIVVAKNKVEFWLNDVFLGDIIIPSANGLPCLSASQPLFIQKYCSGSVSNTNTMRVSNVTVLLMDIAANKPWSHQMATQGMAGYVGQNGHVQGKTALWSNNAAPTAVALTNTAAAFTGLGGIVAVLPTLTANNDGILLNYTVPAGAINTTGRALVITGVKIQGAVSVALVGGAVINAYALAFGQTAVSLATTETASFVTGTTHAPRIVPIGIESYAANAAVGTLGGNGCTLQLTTPVVVRPGENVAIVVRNVGVVTTSGVITLTATFDAYWE